MSEGSRPRVALVTGGSSGIGKATCIAFAQAGAKVVVAARRNKEGEEVARTIREGGGDACFVQTDVSRAEEVKRLIESTIKAYGHLDWACNNAAIEGVRATVADCTEEEWNQVIGVNLTGVWLCMKSEIVQMLKEGGGEIVNVSSANAFIGAAGFAPYTASKHGVVGMTKSAAKEYAKMGIRVNVVCPGSVNTPMIERLDGGPATAESWRITRAPMGRIGNPEEIANAVVWLCSGGASFVTGQSLIVDGGLLA